ncbi:hypothetical protein [Propionivibrio sp.]|uniref:hypothetical protein n=1 Tax=Propionivibrio sp. TaxID=2212460 RepID=UPI0039E598EB
MFTAGHIPDLRGRISGGWRPSGHRPAHPEKRAGIQTRRAPDDATGRQEGNCSERGNGFDAAQDDSCAGAIFTNENTVAKKPDR